MKRKFFFTCLVLFFSLIPTGYTSSSFTLHFIDVGEGDSTFIKAPGGQAAVVDTGNLITGYKATEYILKENPSHLNFLILSHPHWDHVGGVFYMLQRMSVDKLHDNGQDLSDWVITESPYRWYEELVRKYKRYRPLKAGDHFFLGEAQIMVLWPERPSPVDGWNANSLILRILFKNFACLLVGDLEAAAEEHILKKTMDLEADILKIGHHGAGDASSESFLKAVSPKISVISVDRKNHFGFPSPKVLKRLKALKSKIYRTDEDGTIIINVGEDGTIKVTKEK